MIKKFYKNWWSFWRDVGFTRWTSHFVSKSMSRQATKDNPKVILEVWAGRGNVTRHLLKHKDPYTSLYSVELLPDSYKTLSGLRGDNFFHHCIDVRDIDASIIPWGKVDVIVSTLPLGSLDPSLRESILLKLSDLLKDWGTYLQYQYWPKNLKDVKKFFSVQSVRYDLRNSPPVFIYTSTK